MESNFLTIYPNPTNNIISVHGSTQELEEIKIINALGQDLTNLISFTNENVSKVLIDLSNLTQGIYYLKTKTSTNCIFKK